jgi:carboxyl-terminal processing protease
MKTNLRRFISFVVGLFLFSTVTVEAETITSEEGRLWEKAAALIGVACSIYPAIADIDQCADKVVRGILAYRTKTPKQLETLMDGLKARAFVRQQVLLGDVFRDAKRSHERELLDQIVDAIQTSCALPPAVTDFALCMDKAYHGILSSRDPHSRYMNEEEFAEDRRTMKGDLHGIGVEIMSTEDKTIGIMHVMDGSPAEKAGVLDGDRIVAIINGGERVLVSSFAETSEAVKGIMGKPNSKVALEILRGEDDKLITLSVVRAAIKVAMVKTDLFVAPNDPNITYAYVKLVRFGMDIRDEMVRTVKGFLGAHPSVKGIIFDVRGNPGGVLDGVYEVVDALADSPDALVSIRTNDDIHAYGTASDERRPEPQPGDITNGLPVAVLIDANSASSAEIFAGSLKELDRAVIIGKGTWQKGTVQANGPLGDGTGVAITQSEYLIGSPAKWAAVQCVGVAPDIVYEKEVFWKPKKDMRECDLPGVVVSGGARSEGNPTPQPLLVRDPARYHAGEQMLKAVKVHDHKVFLKNEWLRKIFKIVPPKEGSEDTGE